jgi:SAM-dependent methyltransferase
MDSRELGLVLAEQLLGVDDLHYGLWGDGLEPSIPNLKAAQQRFSDMLLDALPPAEPGPVRVLDVGCGTGHLMAQLRERGYHADGVIPSERLAQRVAARLSSAPGEPSRVYECRFEDLASEDVSSPYDVLLFSESFQYVDLDTAISGIKKFLKPGGMLLICDFFKSDNHGDGGPGDGSFGGGHEWRHFEAVMRNAPLVPLRNDDITARVSPNLDLLNDLLSNRVAPAAGSIGEYLDGNYPKTSWMLRRLFRKRMAKIRYKYLAGHRTATTFERYKTYRLLTYRLERPEDQPE